MFFFLGQAISQTMLGFLAWSELEGIPLLLTDPNDSTV
jgi:hypothetical protein